MATLTGADVVELRELATVLDSRAHAMRMLESRLTGRINAVRWTGPDAARFGGEWNTDHRKVIAGAVDLLDGAARDLRANADQQERASAADGGGTGSDQHRPRIILDTRSGPTYVEIAARGAQGPIDYGLLAGAGAQATGTANWDFSAAGLTGSALASARAGAWFDGHVGYTDGPLRAEANAHGFAGALAQAGASGRIGLDGIEGRATAEATAGVRLTVDGALDTGPAGLAGRAGGFAGATASADLAHYYGVEGVSERLKAEAFAGARADASLTGDLLGVQSTARATAMAGIGAHANGDLTVTYEQVHLGFGVGAAVGLGGGVGYDFAFSPRGMVEGVQDVGGDVIHGATTVVSSAWPFD